MAFFKRIFEIAPGALQLFSFKDEKDVYNSAALKKHATVRPGRYCRWLTIAG